MNFCGSFKLTCQLFTRYSFFWARNFIFGIHMYFRSNKKKMPKNIEPLTAAILEEFWSKS